MTRRSSTAALVPPRAVMTVFLLGLPSAACTDQNGEVGVYLAPERRPDAAMGAGGAHVHMPETGPPVDASAAPRCVPGRYDGTFSCNFKFGAACAQNTGTGDLALMGPVSLTLITVPSGEFLAVSGGTLNASSAGFTLQGPLSGSLDCRARHFLGSFEGTYASQSFPAIPGVNGQLSGPIQSEYDLGPPALVDGTWCLAATAPNTSFTDTCADIPPGQLGSCLIGSCLGTWNATYVPGT